ncbi:hypothetical protein V8B97DRAFT_2111459 [Scleroderma yunnanense]
MFRDCHRIRLADAFFELGEFGARIAIIPTETMSPRLLESRAVIIFTEINSQVVMPITWKPRPRRHTQPFNWAIYEYPGTGNLISQFLNETLKVATYEDTTSKMEWALRITPELVHNPPNILALPAYGIAGERTYSSGVRVEWGTSILLIIAEDAFTRFDGGFDALSLRVFLHYYLNIVVGGNAAFTARKSFLFTMRQRAQISMLQSVAGLDLHTEEFGQCLTNHSARFLLRMDHLRL